MSDTHRNSTKFETWLLACRPKTLPAAAAPVILGTAVAFYDGLLRLEIGAITLIAALLLQIGANFANDVFDYQRGADTTERLGPMRVTQAGLLTPQEMYLGMTVVFGSAAVLGLYLISQSGWLILLIGMLSILAALAYTGGPLPYGYVGLGEIFVFLFFGPAAVMGTYYAQSGKLAESAFWGAIPMGLLATGILVVNNLRDIHTDRQAGKMTMAARFGVQFARWEYTILILASFVIPGIMVVVRGYSPWILLCLLAAIFLPKLLNQVWNIQGRGLNIALAGTGRLDLYYALFFSIGLIIAKLWS